MKLRFSDGDVEAFASASGDRNPLHMSDKYATTTPVGRRIVHGALVAWSCARYVLPTGAVVSTLRASFYSPAETNRDYVVEVESQWNVKLFDGRRLLANFEFAVEELDVDSSAQPAKHSNLSFPRTEARTDEPRTLDEDQYGRYFPDLPTLNLGLGNDWLAVGLAATSYFVGMEFPGERALLKKFTLQQGSVEPSIGNLYASLGSTRAIARGLVKTKLELRTQDGPVFWADIGAFILNRPSEPSVIEDAVVLKPKANWQAVVTGTSRGFGANVTAALATRGIPTIGLQRSQSSHPGRVVCDLSRRSDVKKVAARVCADATPVKLLILNAASPLIEQTVDSEHEERITSFIQREVGLALNPLVAFIPELSMNRGTCVLISTAFLDAEGNWTAPPNVSHYLAVKSAEEALMIGAAQAYPDAAFVIARLPPMITTFAFRTSIEAAYEPRPVAELLLDFLEGDLQKGAVTIFPSSMFVTRT